MFIPYHPGMAKTPKRKRGRPRIFSRTPQSVTISIEPSVGVQLRQLAAAEGRSLSAIMRDWIADRLAAAPGR
jgi:hypothetical protein